MATTQRARIRRAAGEFDRDQRLILFASALLSPTAAGMKRRRKASSSRSKAAFLPKGRWLADAESASRPASCERTHILQQSDRREQSFALDAASWPFATGPSPNKQPVRRNESGYPVTNMGYTDAKRSMVEIRQLVGCIPLPAIGPGRAEGLLGIRRRQTARTISMIASILILAAAGYSLLYLLLGGGLVGAILIFVVAKMLGR